MYLNQASREDLEGKKIIEFIKADISTVILTQDGIEISRMKDKGYLVTFKTTKGKDLGIRGLNIENSITGKLTYYPIGTRDGLLLDKVTNTQIFLNGKSFKGGAKEYNIKIICSFLNN